MNNIGKIVDSIGFVAMLSAFVAIISCFTAQAQPCADVQYVFEAQRAAILASVDGSKSDVERLEYVSWFVYQTTPIVFHAATPAPKMDTPTISDEQVRQMQDRVAVYHAVRNSRIAERELYSHHQPTMAEIKKITEKELADYEAKDMKKSTPTTIVSVE
ncbi:MAG TPA: hypothetical protein VMD74_01380 [Candidatus Methylomirabilis sp.]|nr:hypothetical protein [Candidatus Methylomirabilis sp.]